MIAPYTYRNGWNPKTRQYQTRTKMRSDRNSHSFIAGGNAKWHGHAGRVRQVFYQVKQSPIMWSSNYAPRESPSWFENLRPNKNLHENVSNSLIHNFQKLEAVDPSVCEWMRNPLVRPVTECYSAVEGIELSSHKQTWENLKHMLSKETDLKRAHLYDSITWHSRKGGTSEAVKS